MTDEDMEEMEGELVYTVHAIDLDYEFDACKFVDFCQPESYAEAREAEMWFESAPNYPPSPFVAKLMLGDMTFLEKVNVSPKGAVEENTNTVLKDKHSKDRQMSVLDATVRGKIYDCNTEWQMSVLDATVRGLTFYNHMAKDCVKQKPIYRIKSTMPRNSTLMKPTASQLAKQNNPPQYFSTRFNTPLLQTIEKSENNSSGTETQAPKRQKLDGGLLHKIVDMRQPSPLVHKAPRKDRIFDSNSNAKLKLTIPREPEFVARQRVQSLSSVNKTRPEPATPTTAYSFRARPRPLNRKILEAPSMPLPKKSTPRLPEFQEFHLKTAERSVHHSAPSTSLQCGNAPRAASRRPGHCFPTSKKVETDNERPMKTAASKQDDNGTKHMFKALPVNKKVFSSKGELGVSRSTKRNVTVPMEFKFETKKRMQHNPPVDLFSKMSLTPDLHPTNGNEKLPRLTIPADKGSKENKGVPSQQESEMTPTDRERTIWFWPDQFNCSSDKILEDSGHQAGRWLGIR